MSTSSCPDASAGDQLAQQQQGYFSTRVLRVSAICNEGGYSVGAERHVTVCHVYLSGSCWVEAGFGRQRSKGKESQWKDDP